MSLYDSRHDAGEAVADALARRHAVQGDLAVLALPRGGVPVGYEVARRFGAPLDVFVVRKLGVPGHEELAMGAIASGDVRVLDGAIIAALGVREEAIEEATAREREELSRRERAYRGSRRVLDVSRRAAVLVDDGLATGCTMLAAIEGLRRRAPARIVVGVPIAAPTTCDRVAREVDELVCAATPEPFYSVGLWYRDFSQTTDDEVRELLDAAAREYASLGKAPRGERA